MNAAHFRAYNLRTKIEDHMLHNHNSFFEVITEAFTTKTGTWRRKLLPFFTKLDPITVRASRVEMGVVRMYERTKNR